MLRWLLGKWARSYHRIVVGSYVLLIKVELKFLSKIGQSETLSELSATIMFCEQLVIKYISCPTGIVEGRTAGRPDRPTRCQRGEHLRRRERGELPRPASPPRRKVRAVVRREFATMERAHWLDRSPLLWLAMRCRPRSSNAWIIGAIGLAGYVPALLAAFIEGEWNFFFSPGLALFACFTVNAAFKTHVATQASFAFSRDRADDPLSLLLATPVTPRQLVEGHLLAIRETMRPWVGRALWIEGGWLAITILIHASGNQGFTLLYALAALALLALLIPDLQAVGWTALWHGVIARNARAAEQEAFSRVLLLPWLTTIFVWIISFTLNNPRAGAFAVVLTWVMGSLIANSWYGRKSRRQLESKLALWALRRSTGELEHYDGWRRLGRRLGRWWAHQSVARS